MKSLRISGFAVGVCAGLMALAQPVIAHDPGEISSVFLSMSRLDKRAAPDSTVELCRLSLVQALHESDLHVTESRMRADAELLFAGNYLTITEGPSSDIGEVLLNYSATLKDHDAKRQFIHIGDARGDSAVEACEEAAEDIADEMEDAIDELED